MEAKHSSYDFSATEERLDEILHAADANFEERDRIPPREQLTFTNGFYVYCSALFVDIRGSSQLAAQHKRPTLAKIYRAYISELVAVMKSGFGCREIEIHGDAVWAVYDTPTIDRIDDVFHVAFTANSLIKVINHKLAKRGLKPLTVGIGMSYGRALMIKAGYKGSTINEVVWMGDVVNEASKLCGWGNRNWADKTIMVSYVFQQNLNDHNKGLLSLNHSRGCYHGEVINVTMQDWLDEQG